MELKSRNNGTLGKWNNGKKENYEKEDLPNIPSSIPPFQYSASFE